MIFQPVLRVIESLVRSWTDAKLGLEESIPFDSAWIHLIVGPAIFVAAAVVTRKGMASWSPWLIVVFLAALNEVIDLAVVPGPSRISQYGQSAIDFLLTMAIPTLLVVIARSPTPSYEQSVAQEERTR